MSNANVSTMTSEPGHHMMTRAPSKVATVRADSPRNWSDGRRRFLQKHQERYLQRLAVLRETLIREKDFVRLSLPKNCDKNTGFWETIMADLEETSLSKKLPNTRKKQIHTSLAGGISSELNRRGHLERLRRIRIMQMRRKLPPQLEPLHGVGLGGKKEAQPIDNKQTHRVPHTAYHVDWMRGNHVITPIGDQQKAISSWTFKHLRTIDVAPPNESVNNFPNDIRSLLRRTRHSVDSELKSSLHQNKEVLGNPPFPNKPHSPVTTNGAFSIESAQSTKHSSVIRAHVSTVPPPSPSPQSPFMSGIISHHSSSSSRAENGVIKKPNDEDDEDVNDEEVQVVDRATSPVGFRLPPLEHATRSSISSSANSKRHIVVKIPHGIK